MNEITLIKENDPSINWRRCIYAVTLMQWDYSKTFNVNVGGNVQGFDLLETAVEALYGELEGEELAEVELVNPDGEILICQDDEDRQEEWLKEMVVSVVLIKQEREALRVPPRN